jgi:Ca2+-binding RTX toxin-like protein
MEYTLEPLEPRTLPSASLSGGLLTVASDRRSNNIRITLEDSSGVIRVVDNGALRLFQGVRRILVNGGRLGDVIDCTACPAPVTVQGGRGDDLITGGDADDQLFGGPGNDQLRGGPGRDLFAGDDGADTVLYDDRSRRLVVTIGDGKANDGEINLDTGRSEADNVRADCEILVAGSGDDRITGSAANNTLFGGAGDDTLVGAAGDDVLVGQRGRDLLDGADGNDVLFAGDQGGRDTLGGGNGFDFAVAERVIDKTSDIEFIEAAL